MNKKIQNMFTTSEQSKRLLDIEVPVDSADCCVENTWDGLMIYVFRGGETYSTIDEDEHPNIQYPCWSVGRLMELFDVCYSGNEDDEWPKLTAMADKCGTVSEYIVKIFELASKKGELDFSKLEE